MKYYLRNHDLLRHCKQDSGLFKWQLHVDGEWRDLPVQNWTDKEIVEKHGFDLIDNESMPFVQYLC